MAQCTIYTRNTDGSYTRQTAPCQWQDTRGITYQRGQPVTLTDNEVFVIIPLDKAELPIVSSKDKSKNYIVRGIVDDVITSDNAAVKLQELNALTIKSIAKNDYSIGLATNHWAINAV